MTCIVAVPVRDGVVMGGDSAGVSRWDLVVRTDAKVFRNGPFLMGFTTSFRMGQLLRYRLEAPDHPPAMDHAEYLTTLFVDAVRECLHRGGWRRDKDQREEGGEFIVGYRGRVYQVASDFQVAIPASGYAACGCGAQVALGSLHATERSKVGTAERVRRALEAAEALSAGVRGPFVILDSRKSGEEDAG